MAAHDVQWKPVAGPGQTEADPPDDVLRRFGDGDRDAFMAIYAALGGAVRDWAARFFRGAFEQEEAVQEIWLQAHRMRGAFDPGRGPLRPWLRALAFNRCKEILRARGRRPDQDPASAVPAGPEDLEAVGSLPDRAASEARVRAAVARFAGGLRADEARVLELAVVNEQSNDDVARALGVTVRRAKYLKKKVLAKALADPDLRAALGEIGP